LIKSWRKDQGTGWAGQGGVGRTLTLAKHLRLWHLVAAGPAVADCGGYPFVDSVYEARLDRSKEQIKFNNKYYQDKKLSFKKGDALEIPFPENSFDVLLNVESSRAYLNFNRFLSEVKRVLPKFSHQWARNFSGIKGSGSYESFKTGGRKYFSFVLRNLP